MQKPKYKIIMNYIREKIGSGEWSIGTTIPSQRELAKQFEVNRSTVITALEELISEGLLEGKLGKGTIVSNNTWSLLNNRKPMNWNENVTFGSHKESIKTVREINNAESDLHLIQLSKGELSPEIFPLDEMKDVIKEIAENLSPFGYEEPKGNLQLRQAISKHLKSKGIKTAPSSILVVSGALQALQLISVGLLKKGSSVLLEKPSYLYSLSIFQSAEMRLVGLPMDNNGVLMSSLATINKRKGSSILYLNPTFQNPTGTIIPKETREEIITFCEREQIPIIEDDVYGDLWLEGPAPSPLKTFDNYGNVLYLGSLSKTLSPGLRIGWIVGSESVINRLSDLKMQTDYGSSSLSQQVALKWLSDGLYLKHLDLVRAQLKVRRDVTIEMLSKNLGDFATWNVPEGGFFIWLKIHPQYHVKNLYAKAIASGVLLNPGTIYEQESDHGQFIRISFAFASLEDIREGIHRIRKLLLDSN